MIVFWTLAGLAVFGLFALGAYVRFYEAVSGRISRDWKKVSSHWDPARDEIVWLEWAGDRYGRAAHAPSAIRYGEPGGNRRDADDAGAGERTRRNRYLKRLLLWLTTGLLGGHLLHQKFYQYFYFRFMFGLLGVALSLSSWEELAAVFHRESSGELAMLGQELLARFVDGDLIVALWLLALIIFMVGELVLMDES